MRYRVHEFRIRMTRDRSKLEQFLNSLDGEVVAIIPNVKTSWYITSVDFLLIVEKPRGGRGLRGGRKSSADRRPAWQNAPTAAILQAAG